MNNALVPTLAVVAIGAATFGFIKAGQATELEGKVGELNQRLSAQEKSLEDALNGVKLATAEVATLKDNIARLTRERDEARARSKEAGPGSTGETKVATSAQPADLRTIFQGFAKQMDDPEVRKMMKSGQERMIAGAYESLFKKLNLNEEDSKLVAELLADRNMLALDKGRSLLNGQTDDAATAAVRKEIEATKAEYDKKLKGVLGEEKFGELTGYEQTIGDQRALDGFSRSFARKNVPLEDSQKEALANIMREERLKTANPNTIPDLGGGPGMSILMSEAETKAQLEQEKVYQQNVLGRAGQAGLSPDQVNVLQESFKERNERQSMGRMWGRAFLGGGAAPAGAVPSAPAR